MGSEGDGKTAQTTPPQQTSKMDYFVRRATASKPYDVVEAYDRICAGSLPGIRSLPEDLRASAYESYLDTCIMRDIRDLSQIGDELKFRRFMTACAALNSRPMFSGRFTRASSTLGSERHSTWCRQESCALSDSP